MANFASSKNINIMDVSALGQDKEEDDFQLLSAIAENMDTAAFTRLYGKYAKWAFGLFYSRTGSKEAASELSQNLWMYVWDNAGKIIGNHDEKRHTIKGLLYAVIAKRILDFYRMVESCHNIVSLDDEEIWRMVVNIADNNPTVFSKLDVEAIHTITDEVLERFGELDKKVFVSMKNGYTAKEVADMYGFTEATVRKKVCVMTKEVRLKLCEAGYVSAWKSHATLTLLAKQDLPTFGYNMIDPLKSWCWGSILFYPFKISRFS